MLIVNASNLHVGGGIQVAASFINDIPVSLRHLVSVVASTEVIENISLLEAERAQFALFKNLDVQGFASQMQGALDGLIQEGSGVFTVFGPVYSWRPKFRSVVGFAQPWIIYPENECYGKLSMLARIKIRLKYWLQGQYFKRADLLVVELDHVKEGLIRELGINSERIHVVHNCLSSIYLDPAAWVPLAVPQVDCDLRLGFLGRNYIHKNTAIFPDVADELEMVYGVRVRFYVTFTDKEWQSCTLRFRSVCINVGSLSVAQCPSFYSALDGVIFPSLLECFSATPLEAMAMGKPLFASDRPFNRDVCLGHAHYFDPLSPVSAAHVIAEVFANASLQSNRLRAAREHAINFSSSKERAEKYMALLMRCATRADSEFKET